MFEYLETLRLQPGHIRRRIAFLSAALATGLIATGWLAVAATSGTFLMGPSNYTAANQTANQLGSAFSQTQTGITSLLGAAAAFKSDGSASGITVQTETSTTMETPTVLPF